MPHKATLILLLALSIALLAQTKKPASSAKKAEGPTPVTGKPTTTPSGWASGLAVRRHRQTCREGQEGQRALHRLAHRRKGI